MLFFGITAGVPYLLITSTLYQWLLEEGLSQSVITSFAMWTLPLSIKFLWSHWIDNVKVPLLHHLGQYRSWFILSQIGVMISLLFLSQVVSFNNIFMISLGVLLVSFFSAIQDITLGAYRVTILHKEQQAFGSSQIVIGYRMGILLSGGIALYASTKVGWPTVYGVLALVQLQGIFTTLVNPEPFRRNSLKNPIGPYELNRVIHVLYKEFFSKSGWGIFLIYVFLFKFGDAALNTFTWIFLRTIGFTKEQISLSVSIGFLANALGAALAASVIQKFKIRNSLLITAGLQVMIFLTLYMQANYPSDHILMILTIILENFVCGFAAACMYTLFAYRTSQRFSAIQYTFFASFASLSKMIIVKIGGIFLDNLGWGDFFLLLLLGPLLSFYMLNKLSIK